MIFFFSGTGNTRWAATKLSRRLGEPLVDIAVEKEPRTYFLSPGERIGFCFPVHGWQPPAIVRRFVKTMSLADSEGGVGHIGGRHYCFVACTCGDEIGETMAIFTRDLATRGLLVDFAFSLIMPEAYVCLPFMHTDPPAKEQAKKMRAKIDLEEFAGMILAGQRGKEYTTKGAAPWLFSYVIGKYFNSRMVTDSKFRVDADKCLHCGRCEKSCPTGNLKMVHDHSVAILPSWSHDGSCTCCLACYHHCPAHAINYGRITRNRGQYYFERSGEPL